MDKQQPVSASHTRLHLSCLHLSVDSCTRAKKLFTEMWGSKKHTSFLIFSGFLYTHIYTHTLPDIHSLCIYNVYNYLSSKESVQTATANAIGISFFTFQSVSYIVDSYTKKIPSEKNFLNVALFLSFFPRRGLP